MKTKAFRTKNPATIDARYSVWGAVLVLTMALLTAGPASAYTPGTSDAEQGWGVGILTEFYQRDYGPSGVAEIDFKNALAHMEYRFDKPLTAYLDLGLASVEGKSFFGYGQSGSGGSFWEEEDFKSSGNTMFRLGLSGKVFETSNEDWRIEVFGEYSSFDSDDSARFAGYYNDFTEIFIDMSFTELKIGAAAIYTGSDKFQAYGVIAPSLIADVDHDFLIVWHDWPYTDEDSDSSSEDADDKINVLLGATYDFTENLTVSADLRLMGEKGLGLGLVYRF